MSCYETHKGIIKEINLNGTSIREFLLSKVDNREDWEDESWSIDDILYNDDLHEKYIVVNNTLYEWLEHTRKDDEEDDYCELIELQDGSIKVSAQFYNGGVCLEEVIADSMSRLKKTPKELSATEIIDVACKWLDYHHSKYATKLEGKYIVEGRCQTDLRYFLEQAKTMPYWDAIDAAKK